MGRILPCQLAEEFLLVHPVLEGLAAINEHHRNFVIVKAAKIGVGVDVDFAPFEAATLVQLGQGFLHDLAEMTSAAGIKDDFAGL